MAHMRLTWVASGLCALAAALAIALGAEALKPPDAAGLAEIAGAPLSSLSETPWRRGVGALFAAAPGLLAALGLLALAAGFGAIARAGALHAAAAPWFQRASLALAGAGVAGLALRPLLSLWLTLDAAPGQRFLTIGASPVEAAALIGAGGAALIAWLLGRVGALEDETQSII